MFVNKVLDKKRVINMGFCWVNRYRWALLVVSLVIAIMAILPAVNLVQTADYKVYFEPGDEQLLASNKLGDEYSQSDNLLFVLAPENKNVFTKESLEAVAALTEAAWQIPHSTRVDSITNYQHSYARDGDIVVGDLVEKPESLTESELGSVKNIALNEPNLKQRLISKTGDVTGVNVTITFTPGKVDSETREVVASAREILANIKQQYPTLDIHLTGIVMMNNAFPESSEKDSATLIPIMLLIVLLGLFFLSRSVTATFSTLIVMLLSIGSAMGAAGLLGYKVNPVTGSAPIIILTVSVAACVHILISALHYYRRERQDKPAAVQKALQMNSKPVILASITTAIGFLSMNFSDAPPFRELGNITAVGILMACFLSLTLLPALLNILPIKQHKLKVQSEGPLGRILMAISSFVYRHPGKIVVVGLIASVSIASASLKNELNEDFVRYFDKSFDVRKATEFAMQNLTGVHIIEYDLAGKEGEGIANPEYMNYLETFSEWLYEQPEVIHVNTFSDTIKRLNKNFNDDAATAYRIPEDNELIAQYMLMYETSLPYGLGITDRVKLDKSATRLTVTLRDITNNQLLDLDSRAQQWQQQHFPAFMQSEGLGWSLMFGRITQKNIASMITATLIAALLISALLILPFRSFKLGVLSLIPNILPALVALGIWGLTVGMIGLAASFITALTFGIVVDDTIHLLNRYLKNRRDEGLSLQESLQNTLLSVGRAIIVTSVILAIGFSILSLSGFKVNSIIGLLSAITILVALVMDLILLPALLVVLDSWLFKKKQPNESMESAQPLNVKGNNPGLAPAAE